MSTKRMCVTDVFRESGPKMLEDALRETRGDDFLDAIRSYEFDVSPVEENSREGFSPVAGPPKPGDIDRGQTPDELILNEMAVLKDGRKVRWED